MKVQEAHNNIHYLNIISFILFGLTIPIYYMAKYFHKINLILFLKWVNNIKQGIYLIFSTCNIKL